MSTRICVYLWVHCSKACVGVHAHTHWIPGSKALVSFLSLPAAPSGRVSVLKNLQSLDPSHRISDRDYMGWMDFGRRSAEDYEYPS